MRRTRRAAVSLKPGAWQSCFAPPSRLCRASGRRCARRGRRLHERNHRTREEGGGHDESVGRHVPFPIEWRMADLHVLAAACWEHGHRARQSLPRPWATDRRPPVDVDLAPRYRRLMVAADAREGGRSRRLTAMATATADELSTRAATWRHISRERYRLPSTTRLRRSMT